MTEQRWQPYPGHELIRRPIDTAPADLALCFVDTNNGNLSVARCRNGKWDDGRGHRLKSEPTHWTIWANGDPLAEQAVANG